MYHQKYMREAIKEAELGLSEGGVPIGSVLVLEGKIIGRGRNQRVQKHSVILHAEMDAIENAGQRTPEEYQRSIMYTTLSACQMCSGTIVYLGIRTVVMAENENARGAEEFLKEHNVELINLDLSEMKELLRSNR
ncbi:MAG: nucleoside deaminase [Candidatus Heimdallarchaeota archaeon]|nr:nucleoside deaminase [Candidatus Heimdallarchaeota archaeon]